MVILNQPLPDNSIWKGTRIFFVPKQPSSSVKPSPATTPEPAKVLLQDESDSSE